MPVTTKGGRQRETERLAAVLGHAEATVDALGPGAGGPADDQGFFTRTKVAAETSLLLLAAHRARLGPTVDAAVRRIGRRLTAAARSPELLTWVRLRPHILPELSVPHLVLDALGLPDSAFSAALARAAEATSVDPAERLPWKQIERCWHYAMGAPASTEPVPPQLAATALAARQDALFATREEAYAFTHALIYHTDFGTRQPATPRPAAELAEDAAALLARCLDEDDFDLAAEALFTWPYLRLPWDATSAFALRVLREVEDSAGFLPSMTLSQEHFVGLTGDAARRYFYAESYHTAYVMGLLTAAALAPGVETCPPPASAGHLAGAADRLLDLLPSSPHPRRWEPIARALPPAQRGALVPFLGDVAVRRAVRGSDFALVHRIVTMLLDSDAPPGTATVQAAELALRLGAPQLVPTGHR